MKIFEKAVLVDKDAMRIVRMVIKAPFIAKKALPGQFVVVMVDEAGERIPLTVVAKDVDRGSITLIFQEAGFTTKALGKLSKGDSLYAVLGPLGHATGIEPKENVLIIGGGVGIAEIYPVAKAFKEAGRSATTVLGSRTKDLLILEKELRDVSNKVYIATDDGSYGVKGFVTDILKKLLSQPPHPYPFTLIYAVGPIPMMEHVARISKEYNIKTVVSLNALMVDATGMCGCCRVTVDGKVQFSCIDGPEFDGHMVDWNELKLRSTMYQEKEQHICRLDQL